MRLGPENYFSFWRLIQAKTYALHYLFTSVLQNTLLQQASERRFWQISDKLYFNKLK